MLKEEVMALPAPFVPSANPVFPSSSYIAVRPIFAIGDHAADATICDYTTVQLQVGTAGMPAYTYETIESAEEAIDQALALKEKYPHLRLWYDGHEILAEFGDWRSLAAILAEGDEAWEVVEQVAQSLLAHDAPAVLKAADYSPLIAAAARKVVRQ